MRHSEVVEHRPKLDMRACGWDAVDGPLWLLVTRERDGRLYWSWQLRWNGRTYRGVGGYAKDWQELDAKAEAGRLKAWEFIRRESIMWDANNDCRAVQR